MLLIHLIVTLTAEITIVQYSHGLQHSPTLTISIKGLIFFDTVVTVSTLFFLPKFL